MSKESNLIVARIPDPTQAFREIMEMSDAKAFLAKSGWYPGIQLR